MSTDNEPKKVLNIGNVGNSYYFALEPHELNMINKLPDGCAVEVNLGDKIDLLGGNSLHLSSPLIVNVVLINGKFLEQEGDVNEK